MGSSTEEVKTPDRGVNSEGLSAVNESSHIPLTSHEFGRAENVTVSFTSTTDTRDQKIAGIALGGIHSFR